MVKHRWKFKTTRCIADMLRNAMKYVVIPLKSIIHLMFLFFSQEFVNSYDCGSVVIALQNSLAHALSTRKWKNVQFFFNIGEGG